RASLLNPRWVPFQSARWGTFKPALTAGGEPYFVWLEYGARSEFKIEIERDGETHVVTLEAQSIDSLSELLTRDNSFDLAGREARLLDGNIAYLRPGAFYNLDAKTPEEAYDPASLEKYKSFIDKTFETFIDSGAEHLVLDLRDNGGGDVSFSDPVVAWFATQPFRFSSDFRVRVSEETTASNQARLDARPGDKDSISAKLAELYGRADTGDLVSYEMPFVKPRDGNRFSGRVHVMVNRYSYSNAVTTAALIQDYGFGTIYGEPTRDMATTYGAMEQFSLPNSGFIVGYPKAHIIRPNGEEKSHPVTPDVLINVPSVRGEDDVMLETLVQRLQEN
ncbi:MAG: S41 family peptidase, partial [Pseudomonadota bacterium]